MNENGKNKTGTDKVIDIASMLKDPTWNMAEKEKNLFNLIATDLSDLINEDDFEKFREKTVTFIFTLLLMAIKHDHGDGRKPELNETDIMVLKLVEDEEGG